MLLLGQVASSLILALGVMYAARLLGPDRWAEYTAVMIPVSIATVLMDPGVTTALTKHLSQYLYQGRHEERKGVQLTGTAIILTLSTLLTLAVFLLSQQIAQYYLQRPGLGPLLRVASLGILGQALISTSNAIFYGHQRMGLQSATQVLFAVLKSIAMPALVLLGLGSGGAVMGQTASLLTTGAVAITLTLAFLKTGKGYHSTITREEAGIMLRYGAPIYASSIIGNGLTWLYNSLMLTYVENTPLGNWSAAGQFSVLVSFLVVPISTTLFPLFSKLERGSPNLEHAYRNSIKYSALFILPGALALMALSGPMIDIVYGDQYTLAPNYFLLMLLSYLPAGIGSIGPTALLNGQSKTGVIMRTTIINLLVGAPLSLALIPTYGITGLIATTVIAPLPCIIYVVYWIRRNMGLTPDWESSAKIYISSNAALLATLAVTRIIPMASWPTLILGAPTYLAAYLASLKLTRTLTEEDYRMFRAIVGDAGPLAKPLNRILDAFEKI
jgi:O-antigen/teichoic acid export membrane protein